MVVVGISAACLVTVVFIAVVIVSVHDLIEVVVIVVVMVSISCWVSVVHSIIDRRDSSSFKGLLGGVGFLLGISVCDVHSRYSADLMSCT